MKYPVNTTVIGKFSTGQTVTIKLIETSTDTLIPLNTNSCTEYTNAPGWYYFNTSNITTAPTTETEYLCVMTDGTDEFGNKILLKVLEDTNVIEVDGNAVTGPDDFKADLTDVESALAGTLDANVVEVASDAVFDIDDFKADVSGILTAIAALNDISVSDIEASTVLAKEATLSAIQAAISALNNISVSDIEGSSVLAKEATLTAISTVLDAVYFDGSGGGGMRKNFVDSQIIVLDRDGNDADVFNCFDADDNPSLENIARMELVT